MDSKIDQYFKLADEIHKGFGYVEDWVTIPMEDRREYYWILTDSEVYYSTKRETMQGMAAHYKKEYELDWDVEEVEDKNDVYSDEIYTQRFLPKYVYNAPGLTMVSVDTNTDGNKYLAIFDDKKQINLDE